MRETVGKVRQRAAKTPSRWESAPGELRLGGMILEFLDVLHQLVFRGPAAEIELQHFPSSFGGLWWASCPSKC
jgi:hypothetical protein